MPTPAHRVHYTYAEYLALERFSDVKHEYLDGQIYGMAGRTPEHAALAGAVIGQLYSQIRERCRAHSADLRVRTASGLSTYPDVTVTCGAYAYADEDPQAITNPAIIFEVPSSSTEEYDRGDKFEHYKSLASLTQYVLVSPGDRTVEVWSRSESTRWSSALFREGDRVELAVGASLDVRELYSTIP